MKHAPKFYMGDKVYNSLNKADGKIIGIIDALYLIQTGAFNGTMQLPIYFREDVDWPNKYVYIVEFDAPEPSRDEPDLYQAIVAMAGALTTPVHRWHYVPEFALTQIEESKYWCGIGEESI
jgi:hypothetical protein